MKWHFPYDCSEKDNIKAFQRLPPVMQHTIRTIQARIQEEVETKNPCGFIPTSGFRAESTNRKYGGAMESLHRLGCARDFVNASGFNPSIKPVVDDTRFKVIKSARCWHIEVII